MTSLCEVCGNCMCDHSQWERGLTDKEWKVAMDRELTPEELLAWKGNSLMNKLAAARRAHEQFTGRPFPAEPVE